VDADIISVVSTPSSKNTLASSPVGAGAASQSSIKTIGVVFAMQRSEYERRDEG
jgi:hypothetical protein